MTSALFNMLGLALDILRLALDILAFFSAFFLLAIAFRIAGTLISLPFWLVINRYENGEWWCEVPAPVKSLVQDLVQWPMIPGLSMSKRLLCGVLFAAGVGHGVLETFGGSEQIGAFYEARNHRGTYVVWLFDERRAERGKRIEADIHIESGTLLNGHSKQYLMPRAILADGSVIEFDENYWNYPALELGERTMVQDNRDRTWYAELTDEKVR